ncbi:hypothetical protein WMY93_031996, partial [Mugilogobius chulae]
MDKKNKRRRTEARTIYARQRNKHMVCIGDAFDQWRTLKTEKELKTDAEVAKFLLQREEHAEEFTDSTMDVSEVLQQSPHNMSIGDEDIWPIDDNERNDLRNSVIDWADESGGLSFADDSQDEDYAPPISIRFVTELLGGDTYVSYSVVLPALCHLSRLMEISEDDPAYVVKFKTTFRTDLDTRKSNANLPYLKTATVLDPRFKDLKCLPETERQEVWRSLTRLLKEQEPQDARSPSPTENDGEDEDEEGSQSDQSEQHQQPQDAQIASPTEGDGEDEDEEGSQSDQSEHKEGQSDHSEEHQQPQDALSPSPTENDGEDEDEEGSQSDQSEEHQKPQDARSPSPTEMMEKTRTKKEAKPQDAQIASPTESDGEDEDEEGSQSDQSEHKEGQSDHSEEHQQPQDALSPSPTENDGEDEDEEGSQSDQSEEHQKDCKDSKYFILPLPKGPNFFFIKRSDWQKLRSKQKKRQFKTLDWTNIVAAGVRSVHPYCSFAFKRHDVKIIGSTRKSSVFTCSGSCTFKKCPVKVTVVIKSEISLKAHVYFEGSSVLHSNEIKRRPVRGAARGQLAEKLSSTLPRTEFLKSLKEIPPKVYEAGCRDNVPKPSKRQNPMMSLQKMFEEEKQMDDKVIQRINLEPAGAMFWSLQSQHIFYKRAREDIAYLDATGSIIKRAKGGPKPYYVYELVIRSPEKGGSPFPVATYVTTDHTTASVSYFLASFMTDCVKVVGPKAKTSPIMYMCDGSIVLLQAISINLCGYSLKEMISYYYEVVTGQAKQSTPILPIMHRCLSHIMKNAKTLCKKHAPKHYHLCMHIVGALSQKNDLRSIDELIISSAVVFCSQCTGENVDKHFNNINKILSQMGKDDSEYTGEGQEEDLIDTCPTPFDNHFNQLIQNAELDNTGEPNPYYCPDFVTMLRRNLLPQIVLWSKLLLGDLGRHGNGPFYEKMSLRFQKLCQKSTQNYSRDNMTQGIMEKSQWDLKKIRFQQRRMTRIDDFASSYKDMHYALLREYKDVNTQKKSHRVDEERWKQRKQNKRGVYVAPPKKGFPYMKKVTWKKVLVTDHLLSVSVTVSGILHKADAIFYKALTNLWQRKPTEVLCATIPSHNTEECLIIRHSEICTLKPHDWLTGEVMEGILHLNANKYDPERRIFLLHHFMADVILNKKKDHVKRQTLRSVNFQQYDLILGVVNTRSHWKLLMFFPATASVFLCDPYKNANELQESCTAAQKIAQFFHLRNIMTRLGTWSSIKWRGATMSHPFQKDGDNCGVVVLKIAMKVMKNFPNLPVLVFNTERKHMAFAREKMALQLLQGSVFDKKNFCAMCSFVKPPKEGPLDIHW